jgi:CheY-like chemotaxis protein
VIKNILVLIAEDDENDVIVYRRVLPKIGMSSVRFTGDGDQTIEYLKGEGEYADRDQYPFPNFLVLDIKLPRTDGMEVLKWIKENPSCKVTPTIMISGSVLDEEVQEAYQSGANAYFAKPNSMHEMSTVMKLIHDFWTTAVPPKVCPGHVCI